MGRVRDAFRPALSGLVHALLVPVRPLPGVTEGEWLTAASPVRMLDCLAGRASERKLRLFA